MCEGLKKQGAPLLAELQKSPAFTSAMEWRQGNVAVIECIEEIPCNPCETACPHGAIAVGDSITNLPAFFPEKCIGCGLCVAACPGLAIYLKNYAHTDMLSSITFPYEYDPCPEPGEVIRLADRYGEPVCESTVIRVVNGPKQNGTAVVTAVFSNAFYTDVITMHRDCSWI